MLRFATILAGLYSLADAQQCGERKKMGCKQDCPSGWVTVKRTNHGCCRKFGDCAGSMRHCEWQQTCDDKLRHSDYRGCFKNKGSNRIWGHVNQKTVAECEQLAKQEGKRYFGMEWPQGSPVAGEAQCLTLDRDSYLKVTTKQKKLSDAKCEGEGLFNGDRLGGGWRLALYGVSPGNGWSLVDSGAVACSPQGASGRPRTYDVSGIGCRMSLDLVEGCATRCQNHCAGKPFAELFGSQCTCFDRCPVTEIVTPAEWAIYRNAAAAPRRRQLRKFGIMDASRPRLMSKVES